MEDPRKNLFDAPGHFGDVKGTYADLEGTYAEFGVIVRVCALLNEIQEESSQTGKIELLKGCPVDLNEELIKVLDYTYDPYKVYRIASKSIKKILADPNFGKGYGNNFNEFYAFLDHQTKEDGRTSDAVEKCIEIINRLQRGPAELAIKILKRDLRVKVGPKLINKAYPDLIRIFDVQKAKRLEKDGLQLPPGNYLASIKYNGTRIVAFPFMGKYTLFTSNGRIRENPYVTDELNRLFGDTDFIFEGEMFDTDWNKSMGIAKKSNKGKKNQEYRIFDHLTIEEWHTTEGARTNFERSEDLKTLFGGVDLPFNIILVEQILISHDDPQNDVLYEWALDNGYEGLVYQPVDGYYEHKRSWFKRKPKDTEDVEIFDWEESETNPGTLGAFWIRLESGVEQKCSGFKEWQRQKFWEEREAMRHTVFEAEFDEYTKDGKLLFVRYKRPRLDKTDVT